MAGKDNLYDFNAPTYVDFTKDDLDEVVDDTYFEIPAKMEPAEQVVTETEATMEHEEQEQVQSVTQGRKLSSVGVRQSPRLSAVAKAMQRSSVGKCSLGEAAATSRTGNRNSQVKKVLPQKRVVPRVPGVSSITQNDKEELEAIATFQQKIAQNKKKAAASGPSQPLQATKPREFHFATDQRLRSRAQHPTPAPGPSTSGKEVEASFTRSLRSNTPTLNKDSAAKKGPTIPKPFHFSDSNKRFGSMAELSSKAYNRTPKRASSTEELQGSKKPRGPTVAHTPNLATSRRRRSNSLMTHEERAQQAFEEAQKQAFKAHPVNKKVFQTPTTGYRVEKRKLATTVSGPVMVMDDTKQSKTSLLSEGLDEEMVGIPLSSLPYGGVPLVGKKQTTRIRPFSFDGRDKAKLEEKQRKIRKMLEEEKSAVDFHAQPMPMFEDGVQGVPAKKPPTPTQIKPFALRADQRGAIKKQKFQQQLKEEAQADAEQRKFHAQDDRVVRKAPFIPEKSNRPLTEISNLTLSTEVRATQRSEYDQHVKMAEAEMLAAKKEAEERRAAEELAEVARLRQEAVHKAQPVPQFKPMVIQQTEQVPTVPRSPNFATESRLRSRSRANATFNQ